MSAALQAPEPEELTDAILFSAFLDAIRDDPLRNYAHACDAAETLCLNIGKAEVYWRAPNSGGKTTGGCALDVALSRGLPSLGGTPLPPIQVPNVGWILTQSYKQQVDSSQKALLSWLGNWPHKIAWVQGESKGYIETVYVSTHLCKHGMDERCSGCSRIVFHCAESPSAIGGRIDWAHADEVPPEKVWREVRARFIAGRPFYRYITATPMERRFWAWIRNDFADSEGKSVPVGRRMEIRSTLRDNRFLSPEQIESVLESWKGDPLYDARANGDYVDTEGDCPFDLKQLQAWQRRTRGPRIERIRVTAESGATLWADAEIYEDPIEGASYIGVLDPSLGIKSAAHDPAGINLWRHASRPVLAVRVAAYLDPWSMGDLHATLGERYNKALLDVDMTGGYGSSSITAMLKRRYHNLVRDYHEDRPGVTTTRYGFTISAVNRQEITTAITRALLEDSVDCPSAEVVSCLMGITVDENGKWLAGPGRHDEDMICMGRALHLMATLPAPRPKPIPTAEERLMILLGRPGRRGPYKRRQPRVAWNPS